MDNHDPWWPRPQPTRSEQIVAAIWLLVFVPLMLGAYNSWRLLGPYDKQATAILTVVGYFVVVHPWLSREPTKKQQALYVARSIHIFLDGSGGGWDWDDFTSNSLPDAQVEHLRQRASEFSSPIGDVERQALWRVAEQAEAIAAMTGS